MIEVAIIGPTGSGKSSMAIWLAERYGAYILSLDSLSVYKEVDIASAKPSKEELQSVRHFGVDIVAPDEEFNAAMFMDEYERAKKAAKIDKKHLIIVGGSSFYLKAMIDGLSDMPPIGDAARKKAKEAVESDVAEAYALLSSIDEQFARGIKSSDSYRISRGLEMFFEFGLPPSVIFASAPKKRIASRLEIYEILVDREELRGKIKERTATMFALGIEDEARYLADRYGRETKPIKSIGLKETMEYLDGQISRVECEELINIHTSQLAKRQVTFNKTQLSVAFRAGRSDLEKALHGLFQNI